MNDQLKQAVRAIVYREKCKAPISTVISKLRNAGWKKLGTVDDFAKQCQLSGFTIEHSPPEQKVKRTFVGIMEEHA